MCCHSKNLASIVLIDTDGSRLNFARKHVLVDLLKWDPEAVIRSFTKGYGVDAVIKAVGEGDTFRTVWHIARLNVTVVVVAMYESPRYCHCRTCTVESVVQDRQSGCVPLRGDNASDIRRGG